MSMAPIRSRFSRKTLAIALAAGMSLGGVTIAAPTAGAVGGRTGEGVWYLNAQGDLTSNKDSDSLLSNDNFRYSTWGLTQAGDASEGGYFEDVPVVDSSAVNGFSALNRNGGTSASTAGFPSSPRGYEKEAMQVKDMTTADLGQGVPKEASMDAKKMYYVAFSIVNDIVKNEGLSSTLKSRLKSYGYTGDFGKTAVEEKIAETYHYHWTGEGKISDDQIREGYLWKEGTDNSEGHTTFYSSGDYIASVVASIAGAVDSFDYGSLSPDTPFSFQKVYNQGENESAFSGSVSLYNMKKSDAHDLMFAVTQMARDVSDDAIEKSDLIVHRAGGVDGPLLFSLSESNPAPVEDLPQPKPEKPEPETPATDLHITDVKKDKDGNYIVTRNDGKSWPINLKDINDKITALEKKDTVSPDELKKVRTELDKAKKDIADLSGANDSVNEKIEEIQGLLDKHDNHISYLEGRVSDLEEAVIKEVRDNGDGTYTLIRQNGSEVKGNIDTANTSGAVTNIKSDGKGNLVVTIDGKEQTVPLDKVKITESNKGTPKHTVTITTPDGTSVVLDAYDNYVTDVKKDKDGNYIVTRNDGESWPINLKDIRDKITALENKDTVSPEELKTVQDDLAKVNKDIAGLKSKDGALQKEIDSLKTDVDDLKNKTADLEKRVGALENSTIKEVKDNGDGTYTLIREDGSKVKGNIDTAGNVTNIKSDGKGNLIVTIDGKDQTVPLDQITVTESNKGKKNHTVTITTPDGKSVTFNVFDTYVTDVKKLDNGNYEVTRNDGTKWTINLKDIRDKVTALEKKESPSKAEFDAVKKELGDLNTRVDAEFKDIDNHFTEIEGDITNLRADLTDLEARVTKVESRLDAVETRTDDLTRCVYGAGMAGIPALLSIPLMMMTQLNIPGIQDLNTQIQKQIGVYNADAARAWGQYGGVLQAGAALAGLAGMIGGLAYVADQCAPVTKTDAAQDTDLGKLSSKLEKSTAKVKEGSSSNKKSTEKPEDKDAKVKPENKDNAEQPAEQPAEAPAAE